VRRDGLHLFLENAEPVGEGESIGELPNSPSPPFRLRAPIPFILEHILIEYEKIVRSKIYLFSFQLISSPQVSLGSFVQVL
jgi:hypothetical protein